MQDSLGNRLKHAWNVFSSKDKSAPIYGHGEQTHRQHATTISVTNERSILNSITNRIAIDVASVDIRHIRKNTNDQYVETIRSGLNDCLTVEANIDQTGRALVMDIILSMFDEGVVAVVPIETTLNPAVSGSWDITDLRTAKIIGWMPKHIRVSIYNENTGLFQEVVLEKKNVAIIENPMYQVMNMQNSTLRRLAQKLSQLDASDAKAASGKLDIIIQLPYTVRTALRKQQAEERKASLEGQLTGSSHGIAYIDAAEKVTQLNRSAENQYVVQIENLTKQLYAEVGLTESILNGTASESEMTNYYSRTVEPLLKAITDEFERKFLTKTARTQLQGITFFNDPFKLVPISKISEIADKLTRNEIMTSNEVRSILGLKPSDDPKADQLTNKNMPSMAGTEEGGETPNVEVVEGETNDEI